MATVSEKSEMKTSYLDLSVRRDLIDYDFQSYRLDSQNLPLYSKSLKNGITELTLEDKNLFGFLHFNAFSSEINYLHREPFVNDEEAVVYFVDSKQQIWIDRINAFNNILEEPNVVFDLSSVVESERGSDVLVSLNFPTQDLALALVSKCLDDSASDSLHLVIFSTPDRKSGAPWSISSKIDLLDRKSYKIDRKEIQITPLNAPSKILASRQKAYCINLVTFTVIKSEDEKFNSLLTIHTLKNEADNWLIKSIQQLQSKSYPNYVDLENQHITLISENGFQFVFDSNKDEITQFKEEISPEEQIDAAKLFYLYSQNDEEVSLHFRLPLEISEDEIDVNITTNNLTISIKNEIVFNENLWSDIYPTKSKFIFDKRKSDDIEYNILEIALAKREFNIKWPYLIRGVCRGYEIQHENEKSIMLRELSLLSIEFNSRLGQEPKLVHGLDEQQEVCDDETKDLLLQRFECHSLKLTHNSNILNRQWLFQLNQRGLSACFVLRSDVDGLVWQPEVCDDIYRIQHVATFPALGFVQASKQSKRFINCSPDFQFSLIADVINHVFIYKQPNLIGNLRNRLNPERAKVAKQHVISLGRESKRIVGVAVFSKHVFVLTLDKIFSIAVQ